MTFLLHQSLACCLVDGRPVFLDIARNRYFLLRSGHEAEFLRLIDGAPPADEGVARDVLRLLGINLPLLPIGSTSDAASHPSEGLSELDPETASIYQTIRAVFDQWLSERRIRRCSLADLLSEVILEHGSSSTLTLRQTRLIAAHRAAAVVRTTRGRCLSATLALARALRATGYSPQLVIGVALSPFRAHCWLQHDDIVLNDHPDNVRAFTPILVM